MLSPKELFYYFSKNPCEDYPISPYSQLGTNEVFGLMGPYGSSTPYNFTRIINFLRWVKMPCGSALWDIEPSDNNPTGIKNTGQNKIAPMFKLLQSIDPGAFTEGQHRYRAGTAHSVRNACDLARACNLTHNDNSNALPNLTAWKARMATEYLEYFAGNSLPDCLMMIGPDLVSQAQALDYRAPGYNIADNEPIALTAYDTNGSILNAIKEGDPSTGSPMTCFPHVNRGVPGAAHGCLKDPGEEIAKCRNCGPCPRNPETNEIIDPNHPCCHPGTMYYYNNCCLKGNFKPLDYDFAYWTPSDDGYFDGTITGGRTGEKIKHVGIVERRLYHGACNFDHQSSLKKMLMTFPDYFLEHFQQRNGYNLDTRSSTTWTNIANSVNKILRVRTISLVLSAKVNMNNPQDLVTYHDTMFQYIKDLLWNGYGLLLLSNVGFNNNRDSTGVAYPDRIAYHTYSIIGYDDSKQEFDECVYVLHCPLGDWISGGHPSWGPLPTGSFLVTESILKCMIQYFPRDDFLECRPKPCTLPIIEYYRVNELIQEDPCAEQVNIDLAKGCGAEEAGCAPYFCANQQRGFGMVFALSLTDNFYRQNTLNIGKYYNIKTMSESVKSKDSFSVVLKPLN